VILTMAQRILTGVTPTGMPHLGNYIGAIKPALSAQNSAYESLYFIADYHSLVKLWDAEKRQELIRHNAATWLACGLDPSKTTFYRQSHVPEILTLNWLLTSVSAKGLLNRAHAYKDQVAKNQAEQQNDDYGITMGLFCYPILMAADIVGFNAELVPVGKDQGQHIEIARDIAQRFNHLYGEVFIMPKAVIDDKVSVLPGLDGRKMSKSYGNTIPLFETSKRLRKLINKIKTNSLEPHEPKEVEGCSLFQIYRAFASQEEVSAIVERYQSGIGWGEMKQILFEKVDAELAGPRERYEYYIAHPEEVDAILAEGAEKARAIIQPILHKAQQHCGMLP